MTRQPSPRRRLVLVTAISIVILAVVMWDRTFRRAKVMEDMIGQPPPAKSEVPASAIVSDTELQRIRHVDDVVQRISKIDGVVAFADQFPGGVFNINTPPQDHTGMADLRRGYSTDLETKRKRTAVFVGFDISAVCSPTDAEIALISTFDTLEGLSLNNDGGFYPDVGRERLFDRIAVSDASIGSIAKLSRLRYLNVDQTQLTPDGFIQLLPHLTHLEILTATFTHINDDVIRTLPSIKELKLRWLDLMGTAITDAAIPSLCKLRSLKSLNVSRTQITAEGIQTLRRELPKCSVQ